MTEPEDRGREVGRARPGAWLPGLRQSRRRRRSEELRGSERYQCAKRCSDKGAGGSRNAPCRARVPHRTSRPPRPAPPRAPDSQGLDREGPRKKWSLRPIRILRIRTTKNSGSRDSGTSLYLGAIHPLARRIAKTPSCYFVDWS